MALVQILLIGEDCRKSITLKDAMQYISEMDFVAALNEHKKIVRVDADYCLKLIWK